MKLLLLGAGLAAGFLALRYLQNKAPLKDLTLEDIESPILYLKDDWKRVWEVKGKAARRLAK